MSKRIQKKRTKEVRGWIAGGVRNFVSRPQGGAKDDALESLALDMLKFDVWIAITLLHQWYPSARTGVWTKEISTPELTSPDAERLEGSGTLMYARTSDDSEVATARYEFSARRTKGTWTVHALRVIGPTDLVSRAVV